MSFLTRSRIWPTDASTVYWRPRNFFRVLVLAGLSTITRFLVTMAVNALRRSSISPVRRNAQLARAAEAGRGQYHRPPRSARRAPAARRSILVTTGLRRPGGMNRPRTGLWWFPRSVDRISPRNPSIPFPPHSPEGGGRRRHLPPACWRSFVRVTATSTPAGAGRSKKVANRRAPPERSALARLQRGEPLAHDLELLLAPRLVQEAHRLARPAQRAHALAIDLQALAGLPPALGEAALLEARGDLGQRVEVLADQHHVAAGRKGGLGALRQVAPLGEGLHLEVVGEGQAGETQAVAQEALEHGRGEARRALLDVVGRIDGVRRHHRSGQAHQGGEGPQVELELRGLEVDAGQALVSVGRGGPEPGEMLDAATHPSAVQAAQEGAGARRHERGARPVVAAVESVAALAAVDVDDRRQVHVEVEQAQRLGHPASGRERQRRRPARQPGGGRSGPHHLLQAIHPAALAVDGEEGPRHDPAQLAHQREQLLGAPDVALEEDHAAGLEAGEQRSGRGVEVSPRNAHEQEFGGAHPKRNFNVCNKLRAASGASWSRSTSRNKQAITCSAGAKRVICAGASDAGALPRARRGLPDGSYSWASRLARISPARSTTASGRPARRATWRP